MKILIAEDDGASRLLLKKIVEKQGHEVIEAADGEEAWQAYLCGDVSFVLLDWMMPKMDGIEICRKIRAYEHDHDRDYTYIIMVTVKSGTKDLIEGMEAGADDFVSKPYEPSVLAVRTKAGERLLSAKEEVKQAEERYRLIFENMLDGYYRTDSEGNLILINESMVEIMGYDTIEEGLGRNIAEIFYYDTREREEFMHALAKSEGRLRDREVRLKRKDGSLIILSANTRYYHDKEGKVAGVEGVLRDITERKQMEEALWEFGDYQNNVIASANVPIIVFTPKFVVTIFNPAAEDQTGYKADEIIGNKLDILLPDAYKEESMRIIRDAFLEGRELSLVEMLIKKKGGDIRTFLWNSANICDKEGNLHSIVAHCIDITERT